MDADFHSLWTIKVLGKRGAEFVVVMLVKWIVLLGNVLSVVSVQNAGDKTFGKLSQINALM